MIRRLAVKCRPSRSNVHFDAGVVLTCWRILMAGLEEFEKMMHGGRDENPSSVPEQVDFSPVIRN